MSEETEEFEEVEEVKKGKFGILKDYWKIGYDVTLVLGGVAIASIPVITIMKGIKLYWNWIMPLFE